MTARDEDGALTAAPAGAAQFGRGGQADQAHPRLLYRLLKLSNLIGRPFFTHFAERYDLTMNDLRVLMTLAPMSEAASHELCQVIGMHPMNVSRSVARLRRQGRIVERSDPLNRRRKILTPTPEGWELYRKLTPHVKVLSEFLFGSLSGLEADFLSKLIDLLIQRLEGVDLNSSQLIDARALAQDLEAVSSDARPRAPARRRRRTLRSAPPASSRPAG
jgi:DNA-binding MarR family transcriptional regulator